MSSENNETVKTDQTKQEILNKKIQDLSYIEKLINDNKEDGGVGVGNSEIDKDYLESKDRFTDINGKISFVQSLIEEYSNLHLNRLNIGTKEIKEKYRTITVKYPNLEGEILNFLKSKNSENPKEILETLNNLEGLLGEMAKSNQKNTNEIYISQFLEFYAESSFTDNGKITVGEKYKKIKESGFIEESLVSLYPILLTIPVEKLEKLKSITNNKQIENLNNEEKKSYIDFLESDLQTTKIYFKNFDEFSKENFYKENKDINKFPESLMIPFLDLNKEEQDNFKNLLTDFEKISNKTPDIKEKFILENISKIKTNNILELQKIGAVFYIFNNEINNNDDVSKLKNISLIKKTIEKNQNELLKGYTKEQQEKLLNILNSGSNDINSINAKLALFDNQVNSNGNYNQQSPTEKPAKTEIVKEISPKLKTIADKIEGGEKLVNFLKNENKNEKQSINIGLDGKVQVGKDDNLYYTNSLGYKFEFNKDNSGLDKMFDTIDKMNYFLKIGLGYFKDDFKNMVDTIKDIVPSVSAISIDEKEGNFLDNIETEKILNVFKSIGIIGDFDVNNTKPNIVKDIDMDEKMKKMKENGNVFYDKNTGFNKQNFKEALIKII